jgi:hypothetical protein
MPPPVEPMCRWAGERAERRERKRSMTHTATTAVSVLMPDTGGDVRTAINSAAGLQRIWGVLAGRARLGEGVRIHGDRPKPGREGERRTDFGPTLAAVGRGTAAAFDAGRPLVAHGAGPARCRVWTRWRRAAR